MNERWTLKNLLPEVAVFQRHLETLLADSGYTPELINDLSLVSEEVVVNIIHYGYPEQDAGLREIVVTLQIDESRKVTMEFRDDAKAFNPLTVKERDPDDDRLGGWGIPMLKTLTDSLEYAYEGRENVLRVERSERDS